MDEYLKKLLDDRETRYFEQMRLIEKYNLPIISFMLNIPGKEKNKVEYVSLHNYGITLIEELLKEKIVYTEYKNKDTGMYYLAAVDIDGNDLKKQMIDLEDSKIGRLFDIDVFDKTKEQLTRSKLGLNQGKCLICEKPAKICIREQNHKLDDIEKKILEIINNSEV